MNKISENGNKLIHSGDAERLYLLLEDSNKVYVDNFLLEQHQIDALRFLFKLFNKKSPGAVVNFPQSCGKAATVALFLNAVTNLLKSPVLVLCKDANEMQYWKEILLKWSSYVDEEISVESLNPFIKGKKLFLKTCESMTSYLRRNWSIVVIKENMDMFKLKFEADFKIFLTSTDIKKDLCLLTKIYTWLYTKPKVNILDFVAKEKFQKSIQLDFLLEDFAIRRFINLKPFQTTKKTDIVSEIVTEVQINDQKRRLKNKDATGTKIKRSKRVTTDDIDLNAKTVQNVFLMTDPIVKKTSDQNFYVITDDVVNNQNVILIKNEDKEIKNNDCNRNIARDKYIESNSCNIMNAYKSSIINESNKPDTITARDSLELDVENFIINHKPVKLFPNEDAEVNPNRVNYLGNKSLLQKQLTESLNLRDSKLDSKEQIDFGDISVKEESYKSKYYVKNAKLEDFDKSPTLEESTEPLNIENHSEIDLNEIKSNSKVTLIAIEELGKSSIKEGTMEAFQGYEIRHSEINLTEGSTESLSFGSNSNVNVNEMKGLKNKNMLQNRLIESLDIDDDDDVEVKRKDELSNAQNYRNERLHRLQDNEIIAINEEPVCDLNAGEDENIDGNKRKPDESGKDLDYKISLMEEKALKKFKGSLLDSIF